MDGPEFGEWLEDRYQERGWKQKEFARMIGRSNKTVSGWVRGVSTPRDNEDYENIGRVLGVPPNEVRVRAGRHPLIAPLTLLEAHLALPDPEGIRDLTIDERIRLARELLESVIREREQ